jgi:outer membrane biosynthesis protein TonB
VRRRVIGPRTLVEGAFLIAVPIIVGVVIGAGFWTIIAASGIAYLLIVLVEAFLWYDARSAAPLRRVQPEAPEPVPVREPEPVVVLPAAAPEHVRVLEPEPEPVAAPEPEPEAQPEPVALTPVPDPEPEPAPVAPPPPVPNVVAIGAGPNRWNLWDLERLARENASGDVAQDQERTFILMYLREFADADGMLPIDFDGLVRDSFGELVGAR